MSSTNTPADSHWFALYTKTHHEKRIASILRGKGYAEFLPLYWSRQRHSGRFQDVELPLFSNYVFCCFNPAQRLPILTTPGVFFIIGGLTLASFGYLGPIVAAIMHNLGSLIVVFNSARLVRHGEELDPYETKTISEPSAPSAPRLQPA